MKKALSVTLAILLILITVFSTIILAGAAAISKDKHTATGVKGGQTVYITSNTGWNTELFGNTYRTKVQIKLPSDTFEYFQYNLSTGKYAKMNVNVYKKSGNSWVKQTALSGTFNCNNKGYLCASGATAKTWVLPGKGVQYKITVAPVLTWLTSDYLGFSSASDMKNITVKITSYGTITKVS